MVQYSISSGNIGNAFTILKNGTLVVKGSLDRETLDQYKLTVLASDCKLIVFCFATKIFQFKSTLISKSLIREIAP